MPNIEIKARYSNLKEAREIAEKLRAQAVGVDHQIDTYFRAPQGRLKLRESSLSGATLIPYIRPNQPGPKRSDYLLIPVDNPAACKGLFAKLLGIEIVVEKHREIFLIDNVRVHLDEVKGLGNFFELEAVYATDDANIDSQGKSRVDRLIQDFRVQTKHLVLGSYRELMLTSAKSAR